MISLLFPIGAFIQIQERIEAYFKPTTRIESAKSIRY